MQIFLVRAKNYIRYLVPSSLFGTQRTKKIVNVNPTVETHRQDAAKSFITVYDYNEKGLIEEKLDSIEGSFSFRDNDRISWINVEGIIKSELEKIAEHFGIHPLITEDILSIGQRPKM